MIIRYREVDGKVEKEIVAGGTTRTPRGEDRPARHFSEQLLKTYYQLECSQGSRFKSKYTKNVIKHVHETALQRFDATGEDH